MRSIAVFGENVKLLYNRFYMEALIHLITSIGILAILLVIFAESGLFIGFFLPGDSLLFTSGFLTQQGHLPINIHLFVFLLFLAAALGDTVGYTFGHKVGRKIFERGKSRFFRPDHLKAAENFYNKHGSITVVLARFVPIVRTFAPIVAGASKMKYSTFLTYNLIGAAAWTTTFTYLGFFAGKKLTEMGINIEIAALLIVFISILPMIIHVIKDPSRRRSILASTKREIKILIGKEKRL